MTCPTLNPLLYRRRTGRQQCGSCGPGQLTANDDVVAGHEISSCSHSQEFTLHKGLSPCFTVYLCKVSRYLEQTLHNSAGRGLLLYREPKCRNQHCSNMKLQEHALPLPAEPWETQRHSLPAGVRSIGKIMPEVLSRHGLSLDELDESQPQPPATAFLTLVPRSHAVLEPMAAVSS